MSISTNGNKNAGPGAGENKTYLVAFLVEFTMFFHLYFIPRTSEVLWKFMEFKVPACIRSDCRIG